MERNLQLLVKRAASSSLDNIETTIGLGFYYEQYVRQELEYVNAGIAFIESQGGKADEIKARVEKIERYMEGKRTAGNPDPPAA